MKRALEIGLNKMQRKDIDELFGENSEIIVNYIKYSTNAKSLVIDCKLLTTNPEMCEETYPMGLELLIKWAWKLLGINESISLTHSIDVK